ncbi:MAG: flavocytochrome c [Treponema sp.]|nr:flavocytochrome c [Treponema sp.]
MNKKPFLITGVFLVLAALAIVIGVRSRSSGAGYNDGEWTGSSEGRNGPISLSLTVAGGKVTGGKIVSEDETDFAKPAEQKIIDQLVKTQSTAKLDTVSGATITSKATIDAIAMALAAAKGEARASSASAAADVTCDIVVIGAGGAGLSAATEAAGKGAKVILLEKMGIAGGNTNSATGGLNASETKVQAQLGIADSNEQYYQDTMKGGYNLNDPELVRNMVEKSAETVDWLMSLGADLSDVGKMAGSTNSRTHRPQGGAAIGVHLVPVLEKAAKDAGVEIRYNSKVTDIMEENGKAAGVKVTSADGDYTVRAGAVIIATGGFGANPDMVVKYKADLAGFGTTNHKGATGDAFAWVEKFGAELVQMEQIQTHPTVVPSNGVMITEAVRGNGAIMVNREGKRFGNEMATRDVMSADVLAQTGKTAYLLFDQGVRESLKAIEGYAKKGLLTEGATPAELAGKLGMDAASLEATVAAYNGYQKSGSGDPDFGRKASEMPRALETGPFYAVEVGPAIHHTMGGIKIDTKAQVITKSGAAVSGLFAAGEVTGGVHGGNRLGGNAVADICVYGKIAGDSALAYIGK